MTSRAPFSASPTRAVQRRASLALAGAAALALATGASAPAAASSASTPGHWSVLDANLGSAEAGTPAVWQDDSHHSWVLWLRKPTSTTQTYQLAPVGPKGTVGKSADIFAGADWTSLSGQPTLLPAGGQLQVVFSGIQSGTGPYGLGCVYSAVGGASSWTLQGGALSASCVNPIGNSAESKTGVLATAYPGGWSTGHGVIYHVGLSAAIPATEPDGQIPIASGTAYKTAVANDAAGNGDFTVVWAQSFSNPGSGDGFYTQDVTAGTPAVKAPGTGTNSINNLPLFGNIAVANSNTHAGVYLAYCSNAATCKVQLWKVGSAKALTVPGSTNARDIALSAGPSGRLWLAWYNESTNKVSIVRTNQAGTKFGPVKTYSTPCLEHGLIGLSSGSSGRVTQSIVPLSVNLSSRTASHSAKKTLTISVTDVGNPVKGAKVVIAGHKATTNAKGKATISLPKGLKLGTYAVTVSATDYVGWKATLTVTK